MTFSVGIFRSDLSLMYDKYDNTDIPFDIMINEVKKLVTRLHSLELFVAFGDMFRTHRGSFLRLEGSQRLHSVQCAPPASPLGARARQGGAGRAGSAARS